MLLLATAGTLVVVAAVVGNIAAHTKHKPVLADLALLLVAIGLCIAAAGTWIALDDHPSVLGWITRINAAFGAIIGAPAMLYMIYCNRREHALETMASR